MQKKKNVLSIHLGELCVGVLLLGTKQALKHDDLLLMTEME